MISSFKWIVFPSRFSFIGVRPNSPPHTTNVSSSNPLCFRSSINAVIALSTFRHLLIKPISNAVCWIVHVYPSPNQTTAQSEHLFLPVFLQAIHYWQNKLYPVWFHTFHECIAGSSFIFITSGAAICIW